MVLIIIFSTNKGKTVILYDFFFSFFSLHPVLHSKRVYIIIKWIFYDTHIHTYAYRDFFFIKRLFLENIYQITGNQLIYKKQTNKQKQH